MRLILLAWLASGSPLAAQQDEEGIAFFEKRVRPLLIKHCYSCHSAKAEKLKGGLLLDHRNGMMSGGDSGPAVVPGDPEESLLLTAVRYKDEDLQMPPKYRLEDDEIAALERWIRIGAPDPRESMVKAAVRTIDVEAGKSFWSFKPVTPPAAPSVKNDEWPKTDLDRFVLARLEKKGLSPVGDADRETLFRRAAFDLTGLPPTPAEIDSFLDDASDTAFERAVDRLLASPRFGERWGRHWLDLARYAESMGRTRNYAFPFAWRYRDYVIRSFNGDKPYDRFLREQIAGDLLPDRSPDTLTATGFLALGSHDLNERNAEKFRMDVADEQIDTLSRAFMALTLSCARCHDHKFDPIPTADYYALAGIFRSTLPLNGYRVRGRGGNKGYFQAAQFHTIGTGEKSELAESHSRQIAQLEERIQKGRAELKSLQKKDRKLAKPLRGKLKKLTNELQQLKRGGPQRTDLAMGVRDEDAPVDCRVHIRGETDNLGDTVPRGFVRVLMQGKPISLDPKASGRLELAQWLSRGDHPLTARVMANRVWHHLFGRGLVATVDNFGATGEKPSHPELLDHLAAGFVRDGWSVKRLIRRIMLTRTYRLSSAHNAANYDVDPLNTALWRMNVRRLEVEALRDSILAISGTLELDAPAASPVMKIGGKQVGGKGSPASFRASPHRSVYQPIVRGYIPGMFETFDFADPSQVIGRRDVTTVATQALFMMNNDFVVDQAREAAKRLPSSAGARERVEAAYRRAFGRRPSDAETDRALKFVENGDDSAWAGLFHALFASAEFRYVR